MSPNMPSAPMGAAPGDMPDSLISEAQDVLQCLTRLRDSATPVRLTAQNGVALTVPLWFSDAAPTRLGFAVEPDAPALQSLVDSASVQALALVDGQWLQFELRARLGMQGAQGAQLQAAWPEILYRVERREVPRLRVFDASAPTQNQTPSALLRHPAIADMQLRLRILDLSIGGCALMLPQDFPNLEPGRQMGQVQVWLDAEHEFASGLCVHYVGSLGMGHGTRLGCEWQQLSPAALRTLSRYISLNQAQHRSTAPALPCAALVA